MPWDDDLLWGGAKRRLARSAALECTVTVPTRHGRGPAHPTDRYSAVGFVKARPGNSKHGLESQMTAKEVRFSGDARDRRLRGVDILTNAVRITLGPKGRNVILEKSYGAPRSTKDGVTVAKEIELEDRF